MQNSLCNLFRFDVNIFFLNINNYVFISMGHPYVLCLFVLHRIVVPNRIWNSDFKRYKRNSSYRKFRVHRWKTKFPNEYFGFSTYILIGQHNPYSLIDVQRIGHVNNYAILWRLQHYLLERMQTKTIPNGRVFNRYGSID